MTIDLLKLLEQDALGFEDKAGNSALDVWLSTHSLSTVEQHNLIESLLGFVSVSESKHTHYWVTMERFVRTLNLKSSELAGAIERSIEDQPPEDPFDHYCAWKSVIHLGGAFSPLIFRESLDSIRENATGLWLDLAITAYAGNIERLQIVIEKLVSDGLLTLDEFVDGYELINESYGPDTTNKFVIGLHEALPEGEFRADYQVWMGESLGIEPTYQSEKVVSSQLVGLAGAPSGEANALVILTGVELRDKRWTRALK